MSMEYTTEVVNITKIKEGFYIGDEAAAVTNLEVIIQFKLTHMINAAGSQIINAWETIGIKYLTLNWSENPSQNLFDSKDEIANRIVSFIDDSFNRGEGLLAHSVRGQNRVCIVVIIYLMKKYKWSLNKCIDFLKSKKQDVDIPKYFLNQIILFENRLMKKGEEIKSIPWTVEDIPDLEEQLMRNTYVNGLANISSNTPNSNNAKERRHIGWADCNPYKKDALVQVNPAKDLCNQKDIKPVTAHKKLTPSKSSIKRRSYSSNEARSINVSNDRIANSLQGGDNNMFGLNPKLGPMSNSVNVNVNPSLINSNHGLVSQNDLPLKKSSDLLFNYTQLYANPATGNSINSNQTTINNTNTSIGINPSSIIKQSTSSSQSNEIRINHFSMESGPQQRSASYTPGEGVTALKNNSNNNMIMNQQYNMKNGGFNIGTPNSLNPSNMKNYAMMNDLGNNTPNTNASNSSKVANINNTSDKSKIIIASKYEHIVNNNINNYFIQNPETFSTVNKYNYTPQSNSTSNQAQGQSQGQGHQLYQNQIENKPTSPTLNYQNGLGPIPNISFAPITANPNNDNFRINSLTPNNQGSIAVNNFNPKQYINKDNKIAKNNENQRINSNATTNPGYQYGSNMNQINEKKFKIIDYSNNNINNAPTSNYAPVNRESNLNQDYTQNKNQCKHNSKILGYPGNVNSPAINNYIPAKNQNSNISNNNSHSNIDINIVNQSKQITFTSSVQPKPLNNYNPNLNKKNSNYPGSTLFNRTNNQGKGPIKIKNDSRKPSTPDQITSISNMNRHAMQGKPNEMGNYGTIYRGSSKSNKNDGMNRPSTAPQKDKKEYKPSSTHNPYSNTAVNKNYSNTMKRLPSPQIQSNNHLSKTQKVEANKYRAPSPMIKSSSLSIGQPGKPHYQNKKY